MDRYIGTKLIQAEPAPAPTQMGEYQPGWLASQEDMLADDWQIVE